LEVAVAKLFARLPTEMVAYRRPDRSPTAPLPDPLVAPRILSADARSPHGNARSPQ